MTFMDFFKKNQAADSVRKEQGSEREIARRIVSRLADGNLRLQMGRYLTAEDLDEERERLSRIRFSVKNR